MSIQVSVLGLDKLSRVLVALQQTVPILVDGMGPVLVRPCFWIHICATAV